jgi:hypothetical protein
MTGYGKAGIKRNANGELVEVDFLGCLRHGVPETADNVAAANAYSRMHGTPSYEHKAPPPRYYEAPGGAPLQLAVQILSS